MQEKEFKGAYPDAAGQGLSKKYAPTDSFVNSSKI
jgi:hypothetical protein